MLADERPRFTTQTVGIPSRESVVPSSHRVTRLPQRPSSYSHGVLIRGFIISEHERRRETRIYCIHQENDDLASG